MMTWVSNAPALQEKAGQKMAETNPITTAAFVIYISGVLFLALISHKVMKNREFMGEYFLGSRGMKSWTLAFAFAA